MTTAPQPDPRPELGGLDSFLLTAKAKELLGWHENQINLLEKRIDAGSRARSEETKLFESRIDAGSRAYAKMDRWIKDHGGAEIVGNEEALEKSRRDLTNARRAITNARKEVNAAREELAQFHVDIKFDSAGDFDRDHPAQDAIALSGELRDLRTEIKAAVKDGDAVTIAAEADTSSLTPAKRRRAATRMATLALRAFNAEADATIASATANNEDASAQKIARSADAIGKLLDTFDGEIATSYVELKVRELRLAIRHAKAKAFERELEKERRAELREQAKAERELEAERDRLRKELSHYENIRQAMQDKGDDEGISRMEAKLAEIQQGIEDVDQRAANIRAGYVYVISNIGAFGERMVKIGLTRRLDPMDRVRELGDASVPFGFDVHALFFADDAVGVEAELHRRFAARRVNRVNLRREFFYATPAEVREELAAVAGDLIEFREAPEADQFRESQLLTEQGRTESDHPDSSAFSDGFGDDDLEPALGAAR